MQAENLVSLDRNSRDYRRLVCTVAFAFGRKLREQLGEDKYLELVVENGKRADGSCASHDFCDANVLMDAALASEGVTSPDAEDCADFHDCDEAYTELWNAAWDMWKANAVAQLVDP